MAKTACYMIAQSLQDSCGLLRGGSAQGRIHAPDLRPATLARSRSRTYVSGGQIGSRPPALKDQLHRVASGDPPPDPSPLDAQVDPLALDRRDHRPRNPRPPEQLAPAQLLELAEDAPRLPRGKINRLASASFCSRSQDPVSTGLICEARGSAFAGHLLCFRTLRRR
jgi:hypothetical protein